MARPLVFPLAAAALLTAVIAGCTPARDDVAEGRRLYLAYGCAACHGESGAGDGPSAALSHFKPKDLRNVQAFAGPKTVEGISSTIAFGVADGRTGMPAYPDVPKREREQMAMWIVSLSEQIDVTDAWVREPPMPATAAAYLSLHNPKRRTAWLTGVSSPEAAFVEMHETRTEDGMMSMRKVDRIALPHEATTNLRPGDLHLMLINLKRPLRAGDVVELKLTFDDGTSTVAKAKVRAE